MKNPRAYSTYFGGKNANGTYQTIINHIPPHKVYMDLFLGNSAIARFIKPAQLMFLNDIDGDVIKAWSNTLYVDFPCFELNNQDAFYWLTRLMNGIAPGNYDKRENVFIFLDPPYLLDTRKNQSPVYRHELSRQEHYDLLKIISAPEMQGYNIMICCYPNEQYQSVLGPFTDEYLESMHVLKCHQWMKNWNYVDYYSATRNGLALERIYMNYELTGELHDYRYVGSNFREREKFNRIKNALIKKLQAAPLELRNSIMDDIIQSFKIL